jgi:AcrR family transcriptional regulator
VLSFVYGALVSDDEVTTKPPTARERARVALTADIKAAAHRQLAEVGAAALSLRAVAREVGMVSSAVYRYFPSRDALLTALIVDAFDAVGDAAEQEVARTTDRPFLHRWLAVTGAVRAWARAHPEDYALVYGSPVPGYEAPRDTADPAARVSLAALRLVQDGLDRGEIDPTPNVELPDVVRGDLSRLRDTAAPGVPDEVLARTLLAWTAMYGGISYELFGHLHTVVDDHDAFFEAQMRRLGLLLAGAT